MREPDEFDQFYKDVRTRLLLLTYCLTGDLSSSRAAVRDAFVVAWHHWRKVSRVEDAEAWVRVRATSRAQRRHTAKLWHREKGLDAEVKATLDALGKLSLTQRRVLLTTELTSASLAEMAREAGLTRIDAERELQTATSQFALNRDVPTTSIRAVLEAVRPQVEDSPWPRATIIRRSGAARRRTHTVIGVAATAAALVLTGTLVTDADGVHPTLAGERIESKGGPSQHPTADPVDVPEDAMLTAETVAETVPGKGWGVVTTNDNALGDGLAMTCQRERYADPGADAALVRTLEADPRDEDGSRTHRGADVRGVADHEGCQPGVRRHRGLVRRLPGRPRAAGRDVRAARRRGRGGALRAAHLGRPAADRAGRCRAHRPLHDRRGQHLRPGRRTQAGRGRAAAGLGRRRPL